MTYLQIRTQNLLETTLENNGKLEGSYLLGYKADISVDRTDHNQHCENLRSYNETPVSL
jgi:hypothetical protein